MARIDPMKARLDAYPQEYLGCRERRHHWDEKGVYRHRDARIYIVFVYECDPALGGCGAERQVWFTREGEFVQTKIFYPRGYLFKLTDKEREDGFRFTSRKVMEYRVRHAKGLENLPER